MAWFGRKRARTDEVDAQEFDGAVDELVDDEDAADHARAQSDANSDSAADELPTRAARRARTATATAPGMGGPYDRADVPDPQGRLDLGSLWVMGQPGMQLRLDVDQERGQVTSMKALLAGSVMELHAFAAPRTEGMWEEIRGEIAGSVVSRGGTADEVDGPVGVELSTRIPGRGPDGRTTYQPARFLGYDGPRWFLRAVITGPAASDEVAATPFVEMFASAVVIRGSEAMAPRELLPLKVPDESAPPASPARPGATEGRFGPLERGPEITEIH